MGISIEIWDKQIEKCEAVYTIDKKKKKEFMISLEVGVPVGFGGTEVLLSREELLYMIDALKGVNNEKKYDKRSIKKNKGDKGVRFFKESSCF